MAEEKIEKVRQIEDEIVGNSRMLTRFLTKSWWV
jgi:hypothetical protein